MYTYYYGFFNTALSFQMKNMLFNYFQLSTDLAELAPPVHFSQLKKTCWESPLVGLLKLGCKTGSLHYGGPWSMEHVTLGSLKECLPFFQLGRLWKLAFLMSFWVLLIDIHSIHYTFVVFLIVYYISTVFVLFFLVCCVPLHKIGLVDKYSKILVQHLHHT